MDEYRYRWECLRRNPEFRRDSAEYQREVWGAISGDLDVAKDATGIPAWARRQSEAIRRFETKYPLASFHHVFAVGKASPFLFDPASMVAKGQAATTYMTEHGGRHAPSPDDLGSEARKNYDAMPEQIKTLWRQTCAATIFAETRMFLPITAATRLEHIRKLWPEVQRQQVRCYGPEARASAKRKRRPSTCYELGLRVWDAVEAGKAIREVARTHRLSIWTAYRYYYQAARDIDPKGLEGLRTPEDMVDHVRSCAVCTAAQATGTSDKYCPWMQRQLGPRSGRIHNAVHADDDLSEDGIKRVPRRRGRKNEAGGDNIKVLCHSPRKTAQGGGHHHVFLVPWSKSEGRRPLGVPPEGHRLPPKPAGACENPIGPSLLQSARFAWISVDFASCSKRNDCGQRRTLRPSGRRRTGSSQTRIPTTPGQ